MNITIKIHHLVNKKNEITEIEMDDLSSFDDVKTVISKLFGNDIFVVPSKRNFSQVPSTVGEYCSLTNGSNFHFSVIHLLPSFNYKDSYFSEEDMATLSPTLDNYFKLQLKVEHDLKDPANYSVTYFTDQKGTEKLIKLLCGILPSKEKDSLTVRLQDGLMTMFGRSIFDTTTTEALEGNTVNSMQIGPYPSIKGGISAIPIFKTPDGFEFAVVQNRLRDKRSRDNQDTYPETYEVSGGYMDGIPNKGGEKGLYNLPKRVVDEAQRDILKGIQPEKAYRLAKARNNILGPVSVLKTPLHQNTLDAVKDELKQEMGLNEQSIKTIRLVFTRQEILPLPTFTDVYYAEVISPDVKNPPPLKPEDTDEIARAVWLNSNAIYFHADSFYTDFFDNEKEKHAVEFPLKHALMLGRAFRVFRDDEIKVASLVGETSLFDEKQNVLAKIQQCLQIPFLNPKRLEVKDILGSTPQLSKENIKAIQDKVERQTKVKREINADEQDALSHLNKEAIEYQKRLLLLVKAFTRSSLKLFSAVELQTIAEGKNMTMLTNAKAPLFTPTPSNLRHIANDDVKVEMRPRSKSF